MSKINVESIIFDLDGTLWDSADNVAKSWNIAVKKLAIPCLDGICISGDELRSTMGMTMDGLARHFFPMLPDDIQLSVLEKCMAYENEYVSEQGGTIYSNEEETLKQLAQDHRLFIVSNCQCGYIEAFLKFSGFGKYFSGYLCWGDTKVQKSITIRLLMKRHSCVSAAYVGDTNGDHNAALKAEIPFVHAAYGFGEILCQEQVLASADSFSGYLDIFGCNSEQK
ncbi:HAD family hydrolase [Huintestinicola sp.]|uniref:HAD family hydrolase n=1 Tax=Huintestinicola sp. TaxID=2981661 RepID=UPI003D7C7ACC